MRELVGKCHPLSVIACSRNRLTWHVREEAGRHDGMASFLSKGYNKLLIKQLQTQEDALIFELMKKAVATKKVKQHGSVLRLKSSPTR